jgi:hypothetical protein
MYMLASIHYQIVIDQRFIILIHLSSTRLTMQINGMIKKCIGYQSTHTIQSHKRQIIRLYAKHYVSSSLDTPQTEAQQKKIGEHQS